MRHHPPIELLLDHAAGTLAEPVALAVSCHVALCADCRRDLGQLEAVGGALLEEISPVEMGEGALEALLARLDEPEPSRVTAPAPTDPETRRLLPQPLWRFVHAGLSALEWRRVGGLFEEAKLALGVPQFKASLMRLKAGSVMPVHTHRGREYTLVLAGGFTDGGVAFGPGDFCVKDASDEHRPIVDADEDCLCLAVLDAPVKLTGLMGRLFNPFLRM